MPQVSGSSKAARLQAQGKRVSAQDFSGGSGGRRYSRMSRSSAGDSSAAAPAARAADKTLDKDDFRTAERAGNNFLEAAAPLADAVDGWAFRVGPQGLGYYKIEAGAKAKRRVQPRVAKIHNDYEKRQGWGRRAMAAFIANDAKMLKSAYSTTANSIEEGRINLNMKVKGGASWYYGDVYVRLGVDPEPFPPRAGDTLLHMALRHKRSIPFVATLIQLGADKKIKNNSGVAAEEVSPADFALAEELVVQWGQERGEAAYAVSAK